MSNESEVFLAGLPLLYCSTSLQPWLSGDSRSILHYTAAMSRINNKHCLKTSAQTPGYFMHWDLKRCYCTHSTLAYTLSYRNQRCQYFPVILNQVNIKSIYL